MKIQYLGTGAAEGFPGVFCGCDACNRARQMGGRNFKTRSCALINDRILIDISPDIYMQALREHILLYAIENVVITHTHSDHFDAFSLALRAREGASIIPEDYQKSISIYGGPAVKEVLNATLLDQPYSDRNRIKYYPVKEGRGFYIGRVWFYPIAANHKKDEQCFLYAIRDESGCMLYANDTGMLPPHTLKRINMLDMQFDLVSMDCARGTLSGDSHMGLEEIRVLQEQLQTNGCVHKNTRYLLNHFSHMCGMTHDEFQEHVRAEGFEVTYDGMTACERGDGL